MDFFAYISSSSKSLASSVDETINISQETYAGVICCISVAFFGLALMIGLIHDYKKNKKREEKHALLCQREASIRQECQNQAKIVEDQYKKRIASLEEENKGLRQIIVKKDDKITELLKEKNSLEIKQEWNTSSTPAKKTSSKISPSFRTRSGYELKTSLYRIHNVEQRSSEWFNLRENRVTGTSAYYLKNNSVRYAIRKSAEREDRDYENDAMRRGRELEPLGIAKFAKKKGVKVASVGFVESLRYESAGFSPDGVIMDGFGEIKTIVEHKAFNAQHHFACYRNVDERVMYQIQYGMWVTGAKDAYLVLYNPDVHTTGDDLLIKHITKDPEIQDLFNDRFYEYQYDE